MKYLFDTDTLIDVLENRDQVRTHITTMIEAGDEIAHCPVTVAELYRGLNEGVTLPVSDSIITAVARENDAKSLPATSRTNQQKTSW